MRALGTCRWVGGIKTITHTHTRGLLYGSCVCRPRRLARHRTGPRPRSRPGCPRGRRWRPGRRVQGAGCRVQGAGRRVQGAGCRVQCAGRRAQGAGCRVQGAGRRVQGAHMCETVASTSERNSGTHVGPVFQSTTSSYLPPSPCKKAYGNDQVGVLMLIAVPGRGAGTPPHCAVPRPSSTPARAARRSQPRPAPPGGPPPSCAP